MRKALKEGYPYVFLLNNDAFATPGLLETLCREVPAHAGAVGCLVLDMEGRMRFDGTYRRSTDSFEGAARLLPARTVNGSAMLISMVAYEYVGGFDERYFCYGEESNWCERAVEAGYTLHLHTGAAVHHKIAASDVGHNKVCYMTRNRLISAHDAGGRKQVKARVEEEYERAKRTYAASWDDLKETIHHALSDGLIGRFGRRRGEGRVALRF